MSLHVVGLFNHTAPFTVEGNLQLCLLVGYGEEGWDLLYPRKEKLPVLYYTIRMTRCEKGRLYCIMVSWVNIVPYSEWLWLAVWLRSICDICVATDHSVRWPFKGEDINTDFMGKLIGSREKWPFIEMTTKWWWPFKRGDINTDFMGKLIGSREKWPFIEVTIKWRWLFRQVDYISFWHLEYFPCKISSERCWS